jgi:hypothetical protein
LLKSHPMCDKSRGYNVPERYRLIFSNFIMAQLAKFEQSAINRAATTCDLSP